MAFERRKTSGTYLYLSRRDPATGRVKKIYVGRGAKADAAAKELAARRKQCEDGRQAVGTSLAELKAADGLMSDLDAAVTVLMEAALLAAGFHRVNYSSWRKRRNGDGHGRREGPATGGSAG